MNTLFVRLEGILQQEVDLYQRILEVSQEKTDIIIKGDTAGLDRITRSEQGFIMQAGLLERERVECVNELMDAVNEQIIDWKLTDLVARAPEDSKKALMVLGTKLKDLFDEQKKANELNGKLIQNNLEYINNLMSRAKGEGSGYTMGGIRVKSEFDTSILDQKV